MKSLIDFPDDFQPIVTITGDRRELPPQSRGDLLAYSVSSTDYMYLNHLGLGQSQVLSDKQFVIDSEEVLSRSFGNTNILVIGSPAVNLLARRINERAPFRFDIARETFEELEEQYSFMNEFVEPLGDDLFIYHQCLDGIVDVDAILRRFVDLEPKFQELRNRAERITEAFKKTKIYRYLGSHPRPVRYLMHKLDKPGIFDSLDAAKRGESIGANKDYGLISVFDNPFSSSTGQYFVIYVAGVHGPATALGLRLLGNRQAFQNHPFGGVFDVTIDRFALFFEKIQQSKERWETRPYNETAYQQALASGSSMAVKAFFSSPAPKNDDGEQRAFNEWFRDLLVKLGDRRRLRLEIEGPYTLAMGGGTNFWDNILAYEQECSFVVHDVTGCNRGVMVELGFSIGKKKKHFLVWNTGRIPFTNWKEIKVPSLLPTSNIETLNRKDLKAVEAILDKKIVAKAIWTPGDSSCPDCKDDIFDTKEKACFIYTFNPTLGKYLDAKLAEQNIDRVTEDESSKESRLCRICQSLRIAHIAFVEISDKDRSGFIVLGIAKANGVRTLAISLQRGLARDFPWSDQVTVCGIKSIDQRLGNKIEEILHSDFA
jgi:hypothetical protein